LKNIIQSILHSHLLRVEKPTLGDHLLGSHVAP
jgi:hypothetical protein